MIGNEAMTKCFKPIDLRFLKKPIMKSIELHKARNDKGRKKYKFKMLA